MKRNVLAAIVGVCLWPAAGRAGLYNPAEPAEGPPNPEVHQAKQFLIRVKNVRFAGVDGFPGAEYPVRNRYYLAAEIREAPASWNVTRRLSLSAYWIRRQKYSQAI